MKLSKLIFVFCLLFAIGISTPSIAQSKGGRKREHRNQKGGRKVFGGGAKSKGNANAFAKGSGKKGFLARIFKKKSNGHGPWVYRSTNPGAKQNAEQARLFSRNRTKNKRYTDGLLARQNKRRSSGRVTGNQSFSKRKR